MVGTCRTRTIAAGAGLTVATACMMLGAFALGDLTFRLGLVGALLAATGLICTRAALGPEWLERTRQDGYDAGYADGCDATRPANVVGIGSRSSGRTLSGAGATQQLGQEDDVRSGADRVV